MVVHWWWWWCWALRLPLAAPVDHSQELGPEVGQVQVQVAVAMRFATLDPMPVLKNLKGGTCQQW